MKASDYEMAQAAYDAAVAAHGFDYEESRLSDAEYAEADPKRVAQYERGIITGGEFDCLAKFGVLPDKVPVADTVERVKADVVTAVEELVFDMLYSACDRLIAAGVDPNTFGPGDTAYSVAEQVRAELVRKLV